MEIPDVFNFRNCKFVITGHNGSMFGYQFEVEYEDFVEYHRHFSIDEVGYRREIRFNPFTQMEADDFTRLVDLGFPESGTLTSEKLRILMYKAINHVA